MENKLFDSDFSSPCFDGPKNVKFHFRWGTKPRNRKQETGNDYDVISGHLVSRETDFSVFCCMCDSFLKLFG